MISRPRDMFPGHNLFNQNIIRPFVGPWGSLVSFVLGVYVTPVQIRTGPLILFFDILFQLECRRPSIN